MSTVIKTDQLNHIKSITLVSFLFATFSSVYRELGESYFSYHYIYFTMIHPVQDPRATQSSGLLNDVLITAYKDGERGVLIMNIGKKANS